mgnify:FL=1|tara:strand:+ start:1373 stop:1642 length:270 start_codon:yes stop_codon:yes gene_type:complete
MARRIPIISYNEELSNKKSKVYKSLVEGVSEAIKTNKKEIKLFEVKNSNTYLTVHKDNWSSSLANALNFYIEQEEYEKCSKIKNLINEI